jgi:hypothetical protein
MVFHYTLPGGQAEKTAKKHDETVNRHPIQPEQPHIKLSLASHRTNLHNPENPAQEFRHGRKRFDKHADHSASIP